MRASLAALALLPISALAITITAPSASQFWVANASNTISWTFSSGDPAQVDVIVTNSNNATLNGDFSIARFLDASTQTFTVTNVTLRPGDNYQVVFINSTNPNQVFANSSDFSVKPAGTTPAPTQSASAPNSTATAPSGSGNSTESGSKGSASGSRTASGAASTHSSAASPMTRVSVGGVAYALGACALASIGGALL